MMLHLTICRITIALLSISLLIPLPSPVEAVNDISTKRFIYNRLSVDDNRLRVYVDIPTQGYDVVSVQFDLDAEGKLIDSYTVNNAPLCVSGETQWYKSNIDALLLRGDSSEYGTQVTWLYTNAMDSFILDATTTTASYILDHYLIASYYIDSAAQNGSELTASEYYRNDANSFFLISIDSAGEDKSVEVYELNGSNPFGKLRIVPSSWHEPDVFIRDHVLLRNPNDDNVSKLYRYSMKDNVTIEVCSFSDFIPLYVSGSEILGRSFGVTDDWSWSAFEIRSIENPQLCVFQCDVDSSYGQISIVVPVDNDNIIVFCSHSILKIVRTKNTVKELCIPNDVLNRMH